MKMIFFPEICLTILALLPAGCAKKLDITQKGSPTSQNFWKTSSDAIRGANAMYDQFDEGEFYGRGFFWYINASDDMVTGRASANGDNVKNMTSAVPNVSLLTDQWRFRYIVIKRALDVLKYVPGIEMDETLKKRFLGEAHFFIGLMYYELSNNYGNEKAGVPIITLDKEASLEPVPRAANVSENYAIAERELKEAADLLPYFDEYAPADYGRPHKTAAWAYLSKMYLYTKNYAQSEVYADMVIKSGRHQLLDKFTDVFTIDNNWSKEYIWSAYSTVTPVNWGSYLPGVMLENKGWGLYNGFGYYTPTKELYDAYEPGDKRREATILKPGDEFMYFGSSTIYHSINSLSGYQFRKYMDPYKYSNPIGTYISTNGNYPVTALNPPLLRYAEVILIKAEARLMQGQNADTELNMIRKRGWESADDNGYPKLTNATMNDLKHERRVELAGEFADRHRDLVRWGDARTVYAQPLHGYSNTIIWPARTFNPEVHNVWPVPQSEIDRSGGIIKQNEGW